MRYRPRTHPTLADIFLRITRNAERCVLTARRLANGVIVHLQRNRNVLIVRELRPRRQPHFATTTHLSTLDSKVVAILNQQGVVAIIRQINIADYSATRLRDTKDASSATARHDFIDVRVGVVLPVRQLAVVVREAQRRVPSICADITSIHKLDARIPRILQQQPTLAHIPRDHGIYRQAVNIPRLDRVAAGAGNCDGVHFHVGVGGFVAVEPDSYPGGEVHRDFAEDQIFRPVEPETEVRVSRQRQIRNPRADCVEHLYRAVGGAVADVDGPAAFEYFAAAYCEGGGAYRAGGDDGDSLAAANGVYGCLDCAAVVGAGVEGAGAFGGCEGAAGACYFGVGRAGPALGVNEGEEEEEGCEEGEAGHVGCLLVDERMKEGMGGDVWSWGAETYTNKTTSTLLYHGRRGDLRCTSVT
jgi:hypothetical protein